MHDRLLAARSRPAPQQPRWPDPAQARLVTTLLAGAPPVVTPGEVDELSTRLAAVARGEALLLQGGDCAETFATSTERHVRRNLRLLTEMAAVLRCATSLPVVVVGRLAGQYVKPRSAPVDAAGLPSYRGDAVNSQVATIAARTPAPWRMLHGYAASCATMRTVRRLATADQEIFVSHEALLLDYECAFVRPVTTAGSSRRYNLSTHFPWIGERTRQPDGAHIALAGLVANPVAVKIGASTTPAQAARYAELLNPANLPGRLTLVSRMGSERVRDTLPAIVERVTAAGHQVVWQCDPMHANTYVVNGYKTRQVDRIADELRGYLAVHRALGTHPGGIHVEVTGEEVAECLGGRAAISEAELGDRYWTACDPRLNPAQARELTTLAAELLASRVPPPRLTPLAGSRTGAAL